MAFWSHEFFGIGDGPVVEFVVGKAPLQSDGRFEISIPDFSRDPVNAEKRSASLQFFVLDKKSSNIVAILAPSADLRAGNSGNLKILPRYDSEILFGPR